MTNNNVCTKKTHGPKLKNKSWVLLTYEAEEEERLEKEEQEREKNKKLIDERKYLLSIGEYVLEDGEIID